MKNIEDAKTMWSHHWTTNQLGYLAFQVKNPFPIYFILVFLATKIKKDSDCNIEGS